MAWIIIVVLVALAIYIAYSGRTPTGFDIKKGLLAVVALAVAGATWFWGLFQQAPSP